jgi:hypothetical protein
MKDSVYHKDIPGWGMDADPENEPTYPMKNYTGADHDRINYERSEQQPRTVEILMSNERPAITRVFGTSVPPTGLSGMIRRYAFKHSEDRYRHWIPLILADRVNMVEGLIDDLSKGHWPDMAKERGWRMELKHNSAKFLGKTILCSFTAVAVGVYLFKKKR